jgi:hypothetical protein
VRSIILRFILAIAQRCRITTSAGGRVRHLLWRLLPTLYRRLQKQGTCPQEFSIGMAVGDSPLALRLPYWLSNPVLTHRSVTDVPAVIVADPFMCRDEDDKCWYLFFEVVNHLNGRGEIGLAVSDDAMVWEYQRIVLAEPFHLSYPYVFRWNSTYYMIPERSRGGGVALYRAENFPDRWVPVANLLEGNRYVDSSILRYDDKWWLFTDAGVDVAHPVLRLYFADRLEGPWQEHPASPLRENDPHFTRPAGRLIVVDGMPIRFAQDVYPTYGASVSAFAITKLTTTEYEERPASDRPILAAGSERWNSHGMHHIDAHRRADGSWIACVDGFIRGRRHETPAAE